MLEFGMPTCAFLDLLDWTGDVRLVAA